MKGAWHLYRPGERWRKPAAGAWVALAGERAEAVNFGGTSMRIVREASCARDPRLARLGPGPARRRPDRRGRGRGACARRARIELGDALLDQSLLAGIGNIFKSEGCLAGERRSLAPARRSEADELGAGGRAARAR